uniref:Myricetin 3-O-glucosyl 1,2-rhamnoside 6'-O-caffeoyltransferase AT2 n=1 Tax=Crocosmia x crocosmiiflora TaxID=1053288 RepID=AT2_CROXC|nr:RecName: Full=Myricetin 3-O-glucosyl 1,2-rhamnoside 6'-O-caffeoyltransferase AT2; AltName: Full=Acyltransferase 2; Short=CcAT2 [Crocosmia x crocosmiiflora]AXB26762.1 myricetin 3-O-glucosyl 1,2-rhamnoside 6'-O-caffeoyl transferase [Crocosmia x crocosmiiflora]
MSFTVTKTAPAVITPSEPTPSGHILPLSFFDRLPFLRVFLVDMIMVYGHGDQPAKVIKEAVAKALVHYYPLAGRLTTDTDDGELSVACTGEGVWFVEATADCRMEDVNYLQVEPLMIPKEQILPSHPEGVDPYTLPFMIQVTQFRCGGFTFATRANHAVFDGIGAGQIKVAIGEMARGLKHPTVKPVWCRDVIRKPIPSQISATEPHDTDLSSIPDLKFTNNQTNIECCSFDLSLDHINHLKDHFAKEVGKICSVFDVIAAKLWQSRTRAIGLQPQTEVSLTFLLNIRQVVLHNELPPDGGYYGNCLVPLINKAPSGQIANAPLFEIVRLIKEAKDDLLSKDSASLIGEMPPYKKPSYADLSIVDWRRLGLYEADFGWGGPMFLVPLNEHTVTSCSTYLFKSPVASKKDVRLVTYCIVKEHLEAFRDEMNDFT